MTHVCLWNRSGAGARGAGGAGEQEEEQEQEESRSCDKGLGGRLPPSTLMLLLLATISILKVFHLNFENVFLKSATRYFVIPSGIMSFALCPTLTHIKPTHFVASNSVVKPLPRWSSQRNNLFFVVVINLKLRINSFSSTPKICHLFHKGLGGWVVGAFAGSHLGPFFSLQFI